MLSMNENLTITIVLVSILMQSKAYSRKKFALLTYSRVPGYEWRSKCKGASNTHPAAQNRIVGDEYSQPITKSETVYWIVFFILSLSL